ncbi:MAG: cytochrome P450 [Caldilineaceae bacterium]|nr:cytochrome P450 [Caldilineaceae bacterium]
MDKLSPMIILTKRFHNGNQYPPGPPLTNALSNLRAFQQRPLDFLSQMEAEFGGVVRFHTGLLPVYLVTSPVGVNRVLQSNHRNYSKQTFTYAMARALSGENLLTSEGAEWVRRRRTVQPLFHRRVLDGFGQVIIAAAQTRAEKWLSRGRPIDLVEEMMGLTLEVAGQTLFSVDLSTTTAEVRAALNTSAEAILGQFQSPLAALWTLVGFPSPRSQALRQANDYLDGLLYTLMAERRDCEEMPVDMLSLLLQAVDEETGKPLTDREIRDEIGVFLTAGHETTALGLTWTWLSLAQNPDTESRLHRELVTIQAGKGGAGGMKGWPSKAD